MDRAAATSIQGSGGRRPAFRGVSRRRPLVSRGRSRPVQPASDVLIAKPVRTPLTGLRGRGGGGDLGLVPSPTPTLESRSHSLPVAVHGAKKQLLLVLGHFSTGS